MMTADSAMKWENISYRLSRRKKLIKRQRDLVDVACVLAILGVFTMLVEAELHLQVTTSGREGAQRVTHTFMHPNTHAGKHACTRARARAHTHTHTHTNTHAYMHARTHTHAHTNTHPCMHACTHTHTHTHTGTCTCNYSDYKSEFTQLKTGVKQ